MKECYILAIEIVIEGNRRLQNDEVKMFINFIEGIIPKHKALLYGNDTFNLHHKFHCGLASLKAGLELIFILEEAVIRKGKLFALRYAITFGEIEVPKRKHMFHGIAGLGISRSEMKMDRLRIAPENRFYVDIMDREESKYFNLLFRLYQDLTDSWSPKDSELISQFLLLWDYKIVAEGLNKTPSLIWKRRKSLKMKQYNDLKSLILKTPEMIVKKRKSHSNEQPPAF